MKIDFLDLIYTNNVQFGESWSFLAQTEVYIEAELILRPRGHQSHLHLFFVKILLKFKDKWDSSIIQ